MHEFTHATTVSSSCPQHASTLGPFSATEADHRENVTTSRLPFLWCTNDIIELRGCSSTAMCPNASAMR